jgi:hypothetical protein
MVLLRRHYEKIIITRPTVSKEEIGFLPGDLREKMDPWIQPIIFITKNMANIPIWPGSSNFFPGNTPFGFYDNDYQFQQDADKFANICSS